MSSSIIQNSVSDRLIQQGVVAQKPVDTLESQSGQAATLEYTREDLTVFFGIGMAINIVMIIVFVIWAMKQWKQNDKDRK